MCELVLPLYSLMYSFRSKLHLSVGRGGKPPEVNLALNKSNQPFTRRWRGQANFAVQMVHNVMTATALERAGLNIPSHNGIFNALSLYRTSPRFVS